MRQVVYRSTTTTPSGRAADDIPGIVQDAIARNGIEGITGLLYCEDDSFLQVIEGHEESIEELLDRLEADRRHRGIRILSDRQIPWREFGGWTMAYRDRRESIDAFDERLRVLLAGVSKETVDHFRALMPA
ncbi:BLUF domain-containing protein [Sphingomonas panacisoli]|uniref:BLUF domain-containing protein n=1 Tax=Sphingomonas panacisoli TaxID=1813879 RepID=A0A5B8LIE9_9SPHN|nr:BLUF domain-containing protein [Sphingomonas panacisoli]QDZ07374.1 BLUF domain-containing protein [Sphingomonas panacisoli]